MECIKYVLHYSENLSSSKVQWLTASVKKNMGMESSLH